MTFPLVNVTPPPDTPVGAVLTVGADGAVGWAVPAASGGLVAEHLNTGNASELAASLDVQAATATVVFSLAVGDVLAGDLFLAVAEAQVTNDLGYNTMVTGYLVLAKAPTDTVGIEVTENNGTNVTPAMHHMAVVKAGTYQSPSDFGARYLNMVCRAASTASKPGDRLQVDADYGRLSVIRLRGASTLTP